MKNMSRIKNLLPLLLATAPINFGLAATSSSISNDNATQVAGKSYYLPHVYVSGYGGSNWIGDAELLAPVFLLPDRNFYIYGEGRYAGAEETDQVNSWSANAGIGYRQLVGNAGDQRVYGGYILGAYNHSSYGNEFWTINPGIESLGERWDFRANAYLPVGDHNFAYQDYASNHGDYSHVDPHDNQTDDMLVTYYENVGYGADAEFGGRLFSINHMPVKAYINGYYFNVDNDDIKNPDEAGSSNIFGIGGRITFQPTTYLTLELKDTYDSERNNIIEAGAKIYLNGFRYGAVNNHVDDQDMQLRLFDPIEHNFGAIDNATSSVAHQGNTDNSKDDPYNPVVPVETNELFFSGDKDSDDVSATTDSSAYALGTAENPYPASAFDQEIVDQTYATWGDHATFVMSGGQYVYDANGQGADVELYENESIAGRTSDYTQPATGSERPEIYGSLTLDGASGGDLEHTQTIDSVILYNFYDEQINDQNKGSIGINVKDGAQHVVISNSVIGTDGLDNYKYFETGVNVGQNAEVTIKGSDIYGYVYDDGSDDNVYAAETPAIGLYADAGSTVTIENDTRFGTETKIVGHNNYSGSGYTTNQNNGVGVGIVALNASVDMTNGQVQGLSNMPSETGETVGVALFGTGKFTMNNTEIDSLSNYAAIGVSLWNTETVKENYPDITDNQEFIATGGKVTAESGVTINNDSNITAAILSLSSGGLDGYSLNIDGTTITAQETGDYSVYGISLLAPSNVYLANSTINVSGNRQNTFGINVAYAAQSNGGGAITLTNTNIGVAGNSDDGDTFKVAGIYVENQGTNAIDLTVSGGKITVANNSVASAAGSYGIYLENANLTAAPASIEVYGTNTYGIYATGDTSTVDLLSGVIISGDTTGKNSKIATKSAYGIEVDNKATLTLAGGEITANGVFSAYGVEANNVSFVNVENSTSSVLTVTANAIGGTAVGIDAHGGTVDFSDATQDKITINATGLTSYGMNGHGGTSLKGLNPNDNDINFGGNIPDANEIVNFGIMP